MSVAAASRRTLASRRKPGLLTFFGRREVLPAVLICPVLIFFIVWDTIPTLWLLGLSFYRFSLTSGRPPIFSGFYNYTSILNDAATWFDLSRTFIFVLLAVGIETVVGMLLGLLFWRSDRLPGRRVALTLLFAPMVVTPVAAGTFWRLIYDPTFGILNWLIRSAGLS
ncbi:MAG: carbohydrate ABC transporter permease, partial [Acetobacteraceae bacterium]